MRPLVVVTLVVLSAACAANPAREPDPVADAAESAVEMVVVNRTERVLTAYAVWRYAGGRVSLGEVGPGRTRTFATHRFSGEVWLSLDALAPPEPSAPRTRQQLDDRRRVPASGPTTFIAVAPGDRIEWEILRLSPLTIEYRRLPSETTER